MSTYTEDEAHRHYLGEEFLTWLWYRCETDGGTFELPDENGILREFGVLFDDFLVLRADERVPSEAGLSDDDLFESTESVLRRGAPSRTAEAGVALLRGKKLARARLQISDARRSWACVLDGTEMCLRSVKPPKPDAEDAREREKEGLDALFALSDLLDHLYRLFLAQRLGPRFREAVIPAMGEWMLAKSRLGSEDGGAERADES
jgi:hypothetical protein